MRYKLSPKSFIIGSLEVKGWRYNITELEDVGLGDFTIRKTDLQMIVSYEREIYDFLWFGLDVGYNRNFNYFLTEPGGGRNDAVVDLISRDAKFLKFSIFLVPPSTFGR